MIIDVHAHHAPEALTGALAARKSGQAASRLARPKLSFEDRLPMMAEAGVERQVLSIASGFYSEDEAEGVACARGVNDEFTDICKARPEQFSFWAALPLPHIGAALDELDRASQLPGFAGVLINCFVLNRSIADEVYEPLYAELNRRRGIVFMHPSQNGLCSHLINDWDLTVCAGASMEDSIAALHLIRRQIPARYPNIRFIVPHFGGILPTLLNRLDGQMPRGDSDVPPATLARRFFYDTVGWGSKAALLAAIEAFGAERLLPGSDYPILLPFESYAQTFNHIREAGLDADMADRILHRNARDLLKI